jgi:triosephosphate isomerase
MNMNQEQTVQLIEDLKKELPSNDASIMIAPTFVNLAKAVELTKGTKIEVVAQNMHFEASGAFTGEISADMLKNIGIKTVILGHSERRAYFGETDDLLAKKVTAAI